MISIALRPYAPTRRPVLASALALVLLIGCGVPTPESVYVPMEDGTRIAIDVWLPPDLPEGQTVPAIIRLGRYWRDYELPDVFPAFVGKYITNGDWINSAGYALVAVDVRGTGASYGVSVAPWSPEEVGDFPRIVDWVVSQPWSSGKVGGLGVSYEGVTADWLAATGHPAVVASLPAYSYCDIYLDVSHPGGIFNQRFVKAWGDLSALMDRNDPSFIDIVIAADPRGLIAIFADLATAALLGVRPITGAGGALAEAIAEHDDNPNVFDAARSIEYRDDLFGSVAVNSVSPLLGPPAIERSAAIRRVVGWLDAGTARGALSSYNTLDTDYHVLVIAPETHTGNYRADPYELGEPSKLSQQEVIDDIWVAVPFFDRFLKHDGGHEANREVHYYTYVERAWKTTVIWPPVGFETQRWYFAAGGALAREAPADQAGEDLYVVDFDATTGRENRWFSGLSGVPIRYPDRAERDQRLLVYESPPLERDYELTGHPVVSLKVSSDHTDGAFYVYLEDVFKDGQVVYLTEGQLRAVHRPLATTTPTAAVFGPYRTFNRAAAAPLVPGEVAELEFDLLPISTIIRGGHRIRVAIAGHDRDTFARYPTEGMPTLRFQRNAEHACWIDLPVKVREDLGPLVGYVPASTPLLTWLCPTLAVSCLGSPLLLVLRRRAAVTTVSRRASKCECNRRDCRAARRTG